MENMNIIKHYIILLVELFGSASDSGTNDKNEGTFYRSDYCQPCPHCGVKKNNNGGSGNKWEAKNDEKCQPIKLYKPKPGVVGTPIKILKSGEGEKDIAEKLKAFCLTQSGSVASGDKNGGSGSQELYEEWKCYEIDELTKDGQKGVEDDEYNNDVQTGGGLCILKNENKKEQSEANSQNEPKEFQKSFHNFFYYWVVHMLKDSIHWRTKRLKSCISNGKKTCLKKCNNDCECFQKWIDKKEKEWDPIKQQFSKQKITGNHVGFIEFNHDGVLEGVLELEFSNENTEEDKKNNVSAEEAEEIKHLQKILKQDEQNTQQTAGVVTEQKNIMDKLIDYEEGIATKCKKCQEPQDTPGDPGVAGRSETGSPDTKDTDESDHEVDDEEDEDDDEEDDGAEDNNEDGDEDGHTQETEEPQEEAVPTKDVDPCQIVKTLFNDTSNFSDACTLKYGGNNSRLGWKCIPSGDKTDTGERAGRSRRDTSGVPTTGKSDGSICVPPRRRKLYIHDIQSLGVEDGKAPSQEDLLKWFVKSAAVETFFLWDRYKKLNTKNKGETQGGGLQLSGSLEQNDSFVGSTDGLSLDGSDDSNPQSKLQQTGEIPNDFLRQMFYTLGDYRDICIGGDRDIVGDTIYKDTSDKDKEGGVTKKISEKIKQILSKLNGTHVPEKPVQTPQVWWDTNAQHIWDGMICSLTYNTDTKSGEKLTQNEELKGQLLEKGNPITKYEYGKVELEEDNTSSAKATKAAAKEEPTTLKNFVKRPTFFRYLEEWGGDFCGTRKRLLKDVRDNCTQDGGSTKKCSGDGLKCNEIVIDKEKIFEDFLCSTCARHCRSYRKWIKGKRKEYDKQEKIYNQQKKKVLENSGATYDQKFVGKLGKDYASIKLFLQNLGPCKNDNEEDNKKIFEDTNVTFKHTKHCDPCSKFKIKCENGDCNGFEKNKCNGNTFKAADDIEKMGTPTEDVVIRVSDDSATGFGDLQDACENAHIFEGIRKDKWKCVNFCGLDICTLEKKNNNGQETGKKYIIMKELLQRWLEYFFEDYNKIKHKISHCINNGNRFICTSDCEKKCKCAEKWIEEKGKEWKTINDNYLKKYKSGDDGGNTLINFLETFIPQTHVKKATGCSKNLEDFDKSRHCNGAANLENTNGQKRDVVECLLEKLRKEAEKCQNQNKNQASVETQDQHSDDTKTSCNVPPDVEDDEEQPLEEEGDQNPVGKQQPGFCPTVEEHTETVDEDTCKAVDPNTVPDDNRDKKNEEDKVEESAKESTAAEEPSGPAGPQGPSSTTEEKP
ncbi:hypothetical protein PFFCH_04697, partial [Plasmodium falciparum FCH/4]